MGSLISLSAAAASDGSPWELTSPAMLVEAPGAGRRVRVTPPEYVGTEVHHSLYLPTDWQPGNSYPVLVEYTGNYWPPSGSTGEVKDANLGYGLSGGRNFIWVVMPCVEKGRRKNAPTWWGDLAATVDYCKVNLPRLCARYGGDTDRIFVVGFSRGAIGASYIGLADDEIARWWRGMITHDHFDGAKTWSYPHSDRGSSLIRLSRLKARPVLVMGMNVAGLRDEFLNEHLDLADFTFLSVPTAEMFDIPEGPMVHPHTDLWMHQPSATRDQARAWLREQLAQP